MTTPIEKLREYGYELPHPKAGRLGDNMNVVQGGNAAELCAVNLLAQIVHNAGVDLEKVKRVLKLTVFVSSAPDFHEQHLVANSASNLIIGVLGDKGRHARSAIGMASLPLGAAVEVEGIVEVEG
jgi:enamine deaminase RidA (YjgF/YER057c/UK114 family)